MSQPIHIEVALKMRDRAGHEAFIANNAKNQAAHVRPVLMTPSQFLSTHAPTQMQAQTVANYLTRMGYTNVVIAPNRLPVSADGTALTAHNAFLTTFAQVKTSDGRIAFANTNAVQIPAALQDDILAVVGLQTVHEAHTFARKQAAAVHPEAVIGHNPTEFPAIYGGAGLPPASNVSIGIVVGGDPGHTRTDLVAFAANAGLPTVATETINTNGLNTTDHSHTVEWNLDSQGVVGMAGGQVQQLIFYKIPTLSDSTLTADCNVIVAANRAKIIIAPVGECETEAYGDGSVLANDEIFEVAAAQGQTFSVPAGDTGADECGNGGYTPSWPAASGYVIAVTGTTLDASTTTWNSEMVDPKTGGSQSLFEPLPEWQKLWGGPGRGVADVAFDDDPASGAKIFVDGVQNQYGGTALSAALFAGAWTHVLQVDPTVGFAGPVIYTLPAADFHDITSGSNGIPAAVGCDLASGRGSMILANVVADSPALGHQPPAAAWEYAWNGLEAAFQDESAVDGGDFGSSIVSNWWDFGDGSTGTSTQPIHTYAAPGIYTVTEFVTDSTGARAARSGPIVAQDDDEPLQALGNTGFESGVEAPWEMTTPSMLVNNPAGANSGDWYVQIGAVSTGAFDNLSQEVTIPSNGTNANLGFCVKSSGDHAGAMQVDVYSLSNELLRSATYDQSILKPGVYTYENFNFIVPAQTVIIRFRRHNISPNPPGEEIPWDLDDITLYCH